MAKAATPAPEPTPVDTEDIESAIARINDETEWDAVTEASPTKIIFDTIGDLFIGDYAGELNIPADQNITKDHPEGEAFDMYLFRGVDAAKTLFSLNKSYKLQMAMDKIEVGKRCRLQYVADIPTGRNLNPMKDITVSVAK